MTRVAVAAVAAAAALAVALAGRADAEPVRVTVSAARDAATTGVAGVVVAFGTTRFAVTDAHGDAELDVPAGAHGVIWARVPAGYTPRPAWTWWDPGGAAAIALVPLAEPAARPLRIVVASDTHVAAAQPFGGDLAAIARDAVAIDPPPAFFALLGDIAQGARADQYALVDAQLAELGVPVVRVAGNHDWYDAGAAWTKRYGPDNYSFDVDSVHFVVWNMALRDDEVRAFFAADLAHVDRAMTIVALSHAPPSAAVAAALHALGVATVLTGHLHGNRAVDHDGLRELSTEPLLMGGIDGTPAGYRVVTISGDRVTSEHRTVVDAPVVAIASPAAGQCIEPGRVRELLVAASGDAVTARVDCATPIALRAAGGWTFRGELPPLAAGAHALEIEATDADGAAARTTATIVTCSAPLASSPRDLVPPLVARWTTSAGGHVLTAAPTIAGGSVYVAVTDLADGDGGGVVALDLATGALRWRAPTAVPVRGSAAVVGDTVVVAQIDGAVLGLDAATGAPRWRTEVSAGVPPPAGAVFAGPTADGDEVFIGGQRRFAALDARTGRERWAIDPTPDAPPWVDFAVLAPVAIARGLAIGSFSREQSGVEAFDRETGGFAWRVDEHTAQPASAVGPVDTLAIGLAAAPVIAGDTVYIATSADEVAALDVDRGTVRWRTRLDPRGFDWGVAILGTPAYARGILVVPTLYDDAVALDAASGAILWRHAATTASPLRATHYRGAGEAGYAASPVIDGDIVWLASTDGELVALALATGAELWRTSLGAPVIAGLAAAGDTLVVASFDGTVRALAPGTPAAPLAPPARCDAAPAAGGCCDGSGRAASWLPAAVAALTGFRRRRARSRSARRAPRPT